MLFLKFALRPTRRAVLNLFGLFYVIYGALVLFSHMELIDNPFDDFYVHNDAAWSFYSGMMNYVLPCEWTEIADNTLYNPGFHLYPLAAFVMGVWGKLGMELGITDLRLFFRIEIFITGAIIIAIMANILSVKQFSSKDIYKYIVPFGLFSYLYVSSAIFTRDTFMVLAYTLGAYIFLKEKVKYRLLWFIVLAFISAGFRPHNGLLFLVYPFGYYYKYLKSKLGGFTIIALALVALVLYVVLNEQIMTTFNSVDNYDQKALANTGGLFYQLYTLPFPINTIVMVVYMLMSPLPMLFNINGEGGTWLNLPNVLSPYLMWLCWMVCIRNLKRYRLTDNINILVLVGVLAFTAIVYGSPDIRRAFAAIPTLYLCYCLIDRTTVFAKRNYYRNLGWGVIAIINIFFFVYVYIR